MKHLTTAAAHARAAGCPARRAQQAAVRPGAAGHRRLHRALCRPAGHRLGHLPRTDRHGRRGASDHRQGVRPGRRSIDHDGSGSGGGDSGGAGVQHFWPPDRAHRGRSGRLRA